MSSDGQCNKILGFLSRRMFQAGKPHIKILSPNLKTLHPTLQPLYINLSPNLKTLTPPPSSQRLYKGLPGRIPSKADIPEGSSQNRILFTRVPNTNLNPETLNPKP